MIRIRSLSETRSWSNKCKWSLTRSGRVTQYNWIHLDRSTSSIGKDYCNRLRLLLKKIPFWKIMRVCLEKKIKKKTQRSKTCGYYMNRKALSCKKASKRNYLWSLSSIMWSQMKWRSRTNVRYRPTKKSCCRWVSWTGNYLSVCKMSQSCGRLTQWSKCRPIWQVKSLRVWSRSAKTSLVLLSNWLMEKSSPF